MEAICDIVGIFDHGHLVAMDTIDHLRSTASDSLNIELSLAEPDQKVVEALRNIPGINSVEANGDRIYINAVKGADLRPRIIREAMASGGQALSFGLQESSLEDILLRLVKSEVSDLPERRPGLIPSFFRFTTRK